MRAGVWAGKLWEASTRRVTVTLDAVYAAVCAAVRVVLLREAGTVAALPLIWCFGLPLTTLLDPFKQKIHSSACTLLAVRFCSHFMLGFDLQVVW